MTENLDSGQAGTSNPANGDSGGSNENQADLKQLIESQAKTIAELQKSFRTMQSDKDRGVSNVSKRTDDLDKKFTELEKLLKGGWDRKEALDELYRREKLDQAVEFFEKAQGSPNPPPDKGKEVGDDFDVLLKEYELPKDDPNINALLTKGLSGAKLGAEIAKYAMERKANPPSLSAAPTPTGAGIPGKLNEQEANTRYSELSTLLREPTKNAAKIAQIEKQLRESGFPL